MSFFPLAAMAIAAFGAAQRAAVTVDGSELGTRARHPPHVLFVVGDECATSAPSIYPPSSMLCSPDHNLIPCSVGYADFGILNDYKTITPTIDHLLQTGIQLTDYYTFKICSPSRAAMLTGRYPWAAGFYDMV